MRRSPEVLGHSESQHEAGCRKCTCHSNNWRQRDPHAGNTDSDRAEPAVLEDPPKTPQTLHREHTGAGR